MMLRILLKKELTSLFARLHKRKGKSAAAPIAIALLLILSLCSYVMLFCLLANELLKSLLPVGFVWIYFALFGLIATVLGVIGSVFFAYTELYKAKDNELLFSMPIPPHSILIARMLSVFLFGAAFEWIVLLPAEAVYCVQAGFELLQFVCFLPMLLLVPLFAFFLSCLLGSLLARISALFRSKTVIQALTAMLAIGLYYVGYFKATEWFRYLLQNSASLEGAFRKAFFPFWLMGRGCVGNGLFLLLFALLMLLPNGLLCLWLSKSLQRLGTVNRGEKKGKQEQIKAARSVPSALFSKELLRFRTCIAYILNPGMTLMILLIGCIVLPVKGGELTALLAGSELLHRILPLILCGTTGFLLTAATISAPSVSLEGKTLWNLKVLPISGKQVLLAKLKLQFVLTLPPALLFYGIGCIVLKLSVAEAICGVLVVGAFAVSFGAFGLLMGVMHPNLQWRTETAAIKQSIATLLQMLGGMGLLLLAAGGCVLLIDIFPVWTLLLLIGFVFTVCSVLLLHWLFTVGVRHWDALCG